MHPLAAKQQTNGMRTVRSARPDGLASSTQISPLPVFSAILLRKPACACGGCPRCKKKLPIQTKLAVSEPGDIYEQEAERVAERVVRMPEPALKPTSASYTAGGSTCPACEPEKEWLVRRKTERAKDSSGSIPDSFLRDIGPGQALDSTTRALLEPRFACDFSQVRVHSDNQAAESARAVNALAYTVRVSRDVWIGTVCTGNRARPKAACA